jgi:hypothetical protein
VKKHPFETRFARVWLALLALLALMFGPGCTVAPSTAKRSALLGLGAAAGGLAAYEISDGKPLPSALGAVGGAVLGNLALGDDKELKQRGFEEGYMQGQSDAIKRQYFLRQAMEKRPPLLGAPLKTSLLSLPLLDSSSGGVKQETPQIQIKVLR